MVSIAKHKGKSKERMIIQLMIRFGDWAEWRSYVGWRETRAGMRYWQDHTDWPLRLQAAPGYGERLVRAWRRAGR